MFSPTGLSCILEDYSAWCRNGAKNIARMYYHDHKECQVGLLELEFMT